MADFQQTFEPYRKSPLLTLQEMFCKLPEDQIYDLLPQKIYIPPI